MTTTRGRRRALTIGATAGILGCGAVAVAVIAALAGPSAAADASRAPGPAAAPTASSTAASGTAATHSAPAGSTASQRATTTPGATPSAAATEPATSRVSGWLLSSAVDPGAWLPTNDLPLDDVEHYSPWYTMYAPADAGDSGFKPSGEMCAQPSLDTLGAYAIAPQDVHDTLPVGDPGHTAAQPVQDIAFFPTTASAQHAYQTLLNDAAGCELPAGTAPTATGLHLTTAGANQAAWATYPTTTTTAGSLGPLAESHLYLVQRGPTLTLLTIDLTTGTGAPNAAYKTVSDPTVLAALGAHLSVYGTD